MPSPAADRAKEVTIGGMSSTASREVMAAGRETIQRTATRWRRVTDGKPCGFCAMVASRGPVYRSEQTAQGAGGRYHDHCGCTVEPHHGSVADWEPTPEEQRFIDAYGEVWSPGVRDRELADLMDRWLAEHPLSDYLTDEVAEEVAEALVDWADAKTPDEVGRLLQEVLGDRGTVSGFDAARLDLDRVRSAAANIEKLLSDFPDIPVDLEIVPIKNAKVFAQASAKKDRATGTYSELKLQLSQGKMRTGSKLGEMFDRSVGAGHFHIADGVDVDPMNYIITHEFGHLVNYAVPGSTGPVIRVERQILDELGIKNENSREAYLWRKNQRSGYARTNYDEAIAEAFADVYVNGDKAFVLSKRRYAELVRLYREMYP